MKLNLLALALLLLPGAAFAQDKATLDTRSLLAETATPKSASATKYLTGANDKLPAFVRVLAKYRQLAGLPVLPAPVVTSPVTTAPVVTAPVAQKKAVGVNLAGVSWYASRQTCTNLLQGGYWGDQNWTPLTGDQLTPLGYPKVWPTTQQNVRLLGAPTGGWVRQTSIACSWKGSGTLTHSGSINQVKGDHTLAFDMPSWDGAVKNTWFSLWGVNAADPFRDFECHDAKVSSGNEFSKEIVESSSKYQVLRFMDWNATNANPTRSWATRPDPRSLENPGMAIENQFRLAKLADADVWFNHSWNDDASYIEGAAKYAHDNLPAGHKVYVELSNEVWNWQFPVAKLSYDEGNALGLDKSNPYYAGWKNFARRTAEVMKVWEKAFADRPNDLVRVLGTQVANSDVTGQQINFPGVAEHVDAIAGAPYFSHDRNVPYTDALLEASVTNTIAGSKPMCDVARAKSPKIRCILYEGGQHELPTDLLPQDQYEKLQRSQFMGDMYYKYLKTIETSSNDLVVFYNDVGAMTRFGAWGQQEYGGQVGAPKQVAVDRYLKE